MTLIDPPEGMACRKIAQQQLMACVPAASVPDAIAKTTAEWMGWRITQRTSRETGIPAGLPYLTGFVINEGIAAEALD